MEVERLCDRVHNVNGSCRKKGVQLSKKLGYIASARRSFQKQLLSF